MQRFFDLMLSSIAIALLLPIFIPVIAVLRFTGEGEVFYSQVRVGKNGVNFELLKFATMLKNSEQLGAGTITVRDDFRVLPVGKFLRKTKINELPQLFNILKGDMSVIGPRPLHAKQFSFYSQAQQLIITSVKPGLSGLGSVVFRDEEKLLSSSLDPDKTYRESISPRKADLECWYAKHNSLSLYFKLILLTLVVVFFPTTDIKRYFKGLPT